MVGSVCNFHYFGRRTKASRDNYGKPIIWKLLQKFYWVRKKRCFLRLTSTNFDRNMWRIRPSIFWYVKFKPDKNALNLQFMLKWKDSSNYIALGTRFLDRSILSLRFLWLILIGRRIQTFLINQHNFSQFLQIKHSFTFKPFLPHQIVEPLFPWCSSAIYRSVPD